MIRCRCPICQEILSLPRDKAESAVACPHCGEQFRAPAAPTENGHAPAALPAAHGPVRIEKRHQDGDVYGVGDVEPRDNRSNAGESPRKRKKKRSSTGDSGSFVGIILAVAVIGAILMVASLWAAPARWILLILGGVVLGTGMAWIWKLAGHEGNLLPCLIIPGYWVYFAVTHLNTAARPALLRLLGMAQLVYALVVLFAISSPPPPGPGKGKPAPPATGSGEITAQAPVSLPGTKAPGEGTDGPGKSPEMKPVSPAPSTPPPPPPGRVAFWNFDNSANRAADGDKRDHQARAQGVKIEPGVRGDGMVFLGNESYFDYSEAKGCDFEPGTGFTVAGWVKTKANKGVLVSQRNSKDAGMRLEISLQGGILQTQVQTGASTPGVSLQAGMPAIHDGQWHHWVVIRHPDGTIEIAINGVTRATTTNARAGGRLVTDVRTLGASRSGPKEPPVIDSGFEGALDEVVIFTRALTMFEIRPLATR